MTVTAGSGQSSRVRLRFVNRPKSYRFCLVRPDDFACCLFVRRPVVNATSLVRQRRERQPVRPGVLAHDGLPYS